MSLSLLLLCALVCTLLLYTTIWYTISSDFFGLTNWASWNITPSIDRGNAIIHTIEHYVEKKHRLPNSLNELIPEYYESIPPPVAGEKRWRYWIQPDGVHFHLQFAVPGGYPSYNYNSAHPEIGWYEDH
jgi:hypothetical protein